MTRVKAANEEVEIRVILSASRFGKSKDISGRS